MAKKKRNNRDTDYFGRPAESTVKGSGRRRTIVVPAMDEPDAYRFTAKIREGGMSGEIFCHNPKRREELGLPAIYTDS